MSHHVKIARVSNPCLDGKHITLESIRSRIGNGYTLIHTGFKWLNLGDDNGPLFGNELGDEDRLSLK